jgi:hypothetical protein
MSALRQERSLRLGGIIPSPGQGGIAIPTRIDIFDHTDGQGIQNTFPFKTMVRAKVAVAM